MAEKIYTLEELTKMVDENRKAIEKIVELLERASRIIVNEEA